MLCVQGEGRGHLTQALAISALLENAGCLITCVTVGGSSERQIPDFFLQKFTVPVIRLASPNFIKTKDKRSISIVKTISGNMLRSHEYRNSIKMLKAAIDEHHPDMLINFYEPLVGWLWFVHKPTFKIISIAHQYTYLHPIHTFPPGNRLAVFLTKLYTKLTSIGSDKILAISMYNMLRCPDNKLIVIPPILRKELFQQQVKQENFTLIYLLNSGYIQDILNWHEKHPESVLHCFTDCANVKYLHHGKWQVNDNLVFHSLNDVKFLELMSRCKGLVCNAGFESVCEAMYLGKPVVMVPVKGHFEQICNAMDCTRIGAGKYAENFDLELIDSQFKFHHLQNGNIYQSWVQQMERIVMTEIESLFAKESSNYRDQLTDPSFSSFNEMPSV